MKPFKKKELAELFWDGNTSLEQEKQLKDHAPSLTEPEKTYFNFTNTPPVECAGLEDSIIAKIHYQKQRKVYLSISAAASVAILLAVATYFTIVEKKVKQEQNFALLEETLNHVSIELTSGNTPEVIYADDELYIVAEN